MNAIFNQVKQHLAKMPDRSELISQCRDMDELFEKAWKYLVGVYDGKLGTIFLVLSSNYKPFIYWYEETPDPIQNLQDLVHTVAHDLFGMEMHKFNMEFEDLGDYEKSIVQEQVRKILNNALAYLVKNKQKEEER